MDQVTQPSLLGAAGGFPIRFLKCNPLWMPRSMLTGEAVPLQGEGRGDLPLREQPGQTMSSHSSGLTDLHRDLQPRRGQVLSGHELETCLHNYHRLRTLNQFLTTPVHFILYCTADQTLFLSNFLSRSSHRGENQSGKHQILPSLFLTRHCSKSAQNDAHQQECFERLETARTLTKQWKYCGYYCKPSVYE